MPRSNKATPRVIKTVIGDQRIYCTKKRGSSVGEPSSWTDNNKQRLAKGLHNGLDMTYCITGEGRYRVG